MSLRSQKTRTKDDDEYEDDGTVTLNTYRGGVRDLGKRIEGWFFLEHILAGQ